jgi:hypothetical protein
VKYKETLVKPILKWQYIQLTKELLLLQNHAADPTCPCKSEGEMCVRKHLLLIEALAEETITIEEDPEKIKYLLRLGEEAKAKREKEEAKLCGQEVEPQNLDTWARVERKTVESWSLACEIHAAEPSGVGVCELINFPPATISDALSQINVINV